MTSDALRLTGHLDTAVSGFAEYVASEDNLFSRDSVHGVFAACSDFVREQSLDPGAWDRLADLVNSTVGATEASLTNAACTCFLENLAHLSHPLNSRLQGDALAFWRRWCEGV